MFKKDNFPLVSIIVPCFNVEKYLKRCLDSLIVQTHTNIEIICVDDCSNDKTLSILFDYRLKDSRIKLLSNKENVGVGKTRALGLSYATGEYIMWCDADDWYEPNMVADMVWAISYHGVDIAICKQNMIDEKNLKARKTFEKVSSVYECDLVGCLSLNSDIIFNVPRVLWNKIFRKSVIDKYNITFPDTLISEDCSFFLKFISVAKPKIYFFDKKLYNYSRRNDSIIGRRFMDPSKVMFDESLRAFDDMLIFIENNNVKKFRKEFEQCYNYEVNYILKLMLKSLEVNVNTVIDEFKSVSNSLNMIFVCDNEMINIRELMNALSCFIDGMDFSKFYSFTILDCGLSEDNKKLLLGKVVGCDNISVEFIDVSNFFSNFNQLESKANKLDTFSVYVKDILKEKLSIKKKSKVS